MLKSSWVTQLGRGGRGACERLPKFPPMFHPRGVLNLSIATAKCLIFFTIYCLNDGESNKTRHLNTILSYILAADQLPPVLLFVLQEFSPLRATSPSGERRGLGGPHPVTETAGGKKGETRSGDVDCLLGSSGRSSACETEHDMKAGNVENSKAIISKRLLGTAAPPKNKEMERDGNGRKSSTVDDRVATGPLWHPWNLLLPE
ncbi:hypothetical protein BGZ60DRAFT_438415 [Tricladium varicosporioides]|nr:hypothetical protein BGZ60DRAFT_438415 [Hymenoscyphus varicosporioides]